MGIRLVKKNEGNDGFSHTWELQAQQAKETLEELTKKFGDADRLAFEIRNFPHRQECDVVVIVDGNPFITAEFEGGRHCGLRWHCFEDDVSDKHLDPSDENAAKNMILAFKEDILDALESLYGFGAIADEGDQRTEKTAWTYLGELEVLEGAKSRQEATEKMLKALGYNPGMEGRWYDKNSEEINIIDVLDNTEWDFAVKTCGQLQESKEKTVKQEATLNALWCVEFCDIYSNVEKEYYNTEADAKARYDELAERGDIEWVETPTIETVSKEEKLSYDDYAESVKAILMGREFEYGPETANTFVVNDYKDIVRKNFDAGKNAFSAAADIDDAYMERSNSMAKIRMIEVRTPIPPYKKDIVIRGGNHHMKPDDIYIRVPYAKLVEMGIVKDGEEPGSSAARAIRNALKVNIKEIPDTRFGWNDYYMTISIGDISKEYYLEAYWFSKNKSGFIPWLLDSHLTIRPEDPWEGKSESALNRITMKDARKALDKLQKDGSLDKALHEITALNSFVGNYLANNDPDVKDNKLNSPERKIVARAVLAHLAEQFGYQPEDLR